VTRVARRGGALDVAIAAALWGTAGTVQELMLPTAAPVAVASARCLAAAAILLLVAAPRPAARAALVHTVRTGGRPLLVATIAMTAFQACYLLGIRTAGVAVGTLVALGSAPVWAGVLALLLRRRPSRRWVLATVLSVAGLVALVGADPGGAPVGGVLLAGVAGLSYATYATASARLTLADRAAVVVVVFTACGLVLLPAVVTAGLPLDVGALLGLGWLAVATTVVPYQLLLRGLTGVDAPTATTLSLLEPLTATLLAVTLVDERLTIVGVAGVVALAVGVLVAGRSGPPRPAAT
jgi:drug/metabolite transporter, DME family